MVSWPQLVTEWIDANAAYKANGDPKDLTAYVNIRKAKTFAPPGDALDRHALADRVDETLDVDRIPDAIEAVTGGTDVQHECLYSVTLGVGAGFELWILDANRIDRCPEDAWVEHDTLVNRRFTRAGGGVSVPRRWCVDAGDGGMMSKILEYTDPRFGRGVYGIKGDAAKATDGAIWEAKIKGSKRSDRTRGRWFTVHVTEAKNDLFGYLSNPGPGPRSVHIAAHILNRYPDFLEQLTAEQRVREPGGRWVWENPKKRDNHWWDALVYALAAAHSIKLAYPQMFRMPVAPAVAATPATQPAPSPSPTVRDTPPPRQPARRGAARSTSADWLSRRRGGRF
jgi:phage terminase large subunit GpA-like protein